LHDRQIKVERLHRLELLRNTAATKAKVFSSTKCLDPYFQNKHELSALVN
jgi:hypothetical protein